MSDVAFLVSFISPWFVIGYHCLQQWPKTVD